VVLLPSNLTAPQPSSDFSRLRQGSISRSSSCNEQRQESQRRQRRWTTVFQWPESMISFWTVWFTFTRLKAQHAVVSRSEARDLLSNI